MKRILIIHRHFGRNAIIVLNGHSVNSKNIKSIKQCRLSDKFPTSTEVFIDPSINVTLC